MLPNSFGSSDALPTIRPEQPADVAAIHDVEALAFGQANEADLVDALRANGQATLSLVAVDDASGRIVGHIMFSPMTVEPPAIRAVGLGPVAVHPEVQNRGIGGDLIRAGVAEIRRQGWDAIFLLGHADYYPRFGFQLSGGMNVTAEAGINMAHFFFMEMWEGAVGSVPLSVKYSPEFWQYG
jgi:putative acetyltransferase